MADSNITKRALSMALKALMLEQGEIIERGDHDDLIAQKGRYYQLYTGQVELA